MRGADAAAAAAAPRHTRTLALERPLTRHRLKDWERTVTIRIEREQGGQRLTEQRQGVEPQPPRRIDRHECQSKPAVRIPGKIVRFDQSGRGRCDDRPRPHLTPAADSYAYALAIRLGSYPQVEVGIPVGNHDAAQETARSNAALHRVIVGAVGAPLGPDLIALVTSRDEIADLKKELRGMDAAGLK